MISVLNSSYSTGMYIEEIGNKYYCLLNSATTLKMPIGVNYKKSPKLRLTYKYCLVVLEIIKIPPEFLNYSMKCYQKNDDFTFKSYLFINKEIALKLK